MPGLFRTLRSNPDPELRFIGLTGLLGGDEGTAALAEIADKLHLIGKVRTGSFALT